MLALNVAAGAMGHWTIDEIRHAREAIPPADYLSLSYYEIWYEGLRTVLQRHGFATPAELDSGAMRSYAIHSPALTRTVALCASKNIPLTNAGAAVKQLVRQVAAQLCDSGRWQGAHMLAPAT